MARSAEHDFVTNAFIESVKDLSKSEVFGYIEADRGRFDFACSLERTNSRKVVGQTLVHHAAGIDKDLGQLLFDTSSEIPVYLYPGDARNEGRVQEVLTNAKRRLPDRVQLLRLFRYPPFDANNENERQLITSTIKRQIIDDLLLNVLFGKLSPVDISIFMNGIGISGLLAATLDEIATNGFFNFPDLGRTLDTNPSTLRPRVQTLVSAGMLDQGVGSSIFRATRRAQVFLKICHLLLNRTTVNTELNFLLTQLDLSDSRDALSTNGDNLPFHSSNPELKRLILLRELHSAQSDFGAKFNGEGFLPENDFKFTGPKGAVWIGR